MKKDFLIWFAGFWEGEGCLFIKQERTRLKNYFSVFQAGKRGKSILNFIRREVGKGVVKGRKRKWRHKKCYEFIIGKRKEIIEICRLLIPYLLFRKKEVLDKLKIMEEREEYSKKYYWSEKEKTFLLENYEKYKKKRKIKELAKKLGRPYNSVVAHYYLFQK